MHFITIQIDAILDILEHPLNFEHFNVAKTIDNIVSWITTTTDVVTVKHSDFNQVTADGASNAIGSVAEYEAQTREERSNDIGVQVCVSHQNQRAGGYASGMHDHAVPVNVPLGTILKKSHTIQVRIGRAGTRMDVLREIQREYGREPMLGPDPGNDTRWDSREDEARRATIIMHDLCKANFLMLSVGGDDHNLLTDEEKKSGDIDRLAYTAEEIMALRQFEASSMEAKYFSKFTQERGNTSAYLLLEIQTVLLRCGSDVFPMHEGMFSSNF
jgi:hypothetical protein